MNKPPAVSVIVNFYNAGQFIEETIESVLAQTFDDWELLLVDDGALDGSTEIARRYAANFPEKIHYLAHADRQNLGASAARNLGIRQARGEYIALLDADDVWLPGKLRRQVELLRDWPEAAMLYGNTLYWYGWTGRPEDAARDFLPGIHVEPETLLRPPSLLARMLRREIPVPCTCSLLMRRAAVLAVGGFEDSFRQVFTDQVFYAKLLLKWPAVASSECWDKYRQHPDSCVSQAEAQGRLEAARLRFLQWLEEYLIEQGARRTEVRRALLEQLWAYRHPQLAKLLPAAEATKSVLRRALPPTVYRWLKSWKHKTWDRFWGMRQ